MRRIHHEIITPDVIAMHRPQAHTCTRIEPQPAAFRLSGGHFEPFLAPNAGYPLVIDMPAIVAQEPRDPSIPIASICARQQRDLRPERLLVRAHHPCTTLCRP